MAATVSSLQYNVEGNRRNNSGTVTADTAYPTGGYSVPAGAVGLGSVDSFQIELPVNATPAIRAARYDYTNSKLMYFDQAFAEIANGVDLSAFSARFEVRGL